MDWVVIGTLAGIVAAVATAIQVWAAWKSHQREEAKRLAQHNSPPSPAPSFSTPTFPTTYSPPRPALNSLESEVGADYTKLRDLLAVQRFKEADQETSRLILWVSRREKESWLDSKSIGRFPCQDLRTIDGLWVQHSNGKFGFSVQKQIYNQVGKDYYKFADEVEWRLNWEDWITYDKVLFELRAPRGHIPPLYYLNMRIFMERGISATHCLFSRIETCKI